MQHLPRRYKNRDEFSLELEFTSRLLHLDVEGRPGGKPGEGDNDSWAESYWSDSDDSLGTVSLFSFPLHLPHV